MLLNFLKQFIIPAVSKPEPEKASGAMSVKELKEYKTRLYGSLSRDLAEFEKNFLLVSVGLLAFSITFIKDIVTIETAVLLPMLTLSWTCIGLAIGLMLFSFMRSVEASNTIWYAIDDFQHTHNLYVETQLLTTEQTLALRKETADLFRESKAALKKMRYWAINSFLAGIAVFFFFISINLFREQGRSKAASPIILKLDPATKEISIEGKTLILSDSSLYLKK